MLLTQKSHTIYYDLIGPADGEVVCLAHALAADSGMWTDQIPALLSAGYQVLRIDMRGHGGSTPADGEYRMVQLSDDINAVVEHLRIAQLHFCGLSIGGMFGQDFALRRGAKLKSLILCDTSPATPPDAVQRWGPRIELVLKANSLEPIADATMGRWLTESYHQKNAGRWQQIRDTVAATTPQGYIGCARAIQNFTHLDILPTIKTPTLVLNGSDDPAAANDHGAHIADLLPNSHYEEIAGARHFPNVECVEQYNRILLDWLKQH